MYGATGTGQTFMNETSARASLGKVLFSVGIPGALGAFLAARASPEKVPLWPVWAMLVLAAVGATLWASESGPVGMAARWLRATVHRALSYRSNHRWQAGSFDAMVHDGDRTIGLDLSPPRAVGRAKSLMLFGGRSATCRVVLTGTTYESGPVSEQMGRWGTCFPHNFTPVLPWPLPAGRYMVSWTVEALPELPAHRFTIDQYGRLTS